ncbi:MAG TPA: endonuclease domain-containing protein [Candidatus Moranbacteria bacterium]|nr:endonuclease domain-containing protein [Candidatus Moranbacteria bacterium]
MQKTKRARTLRKNQTPQEIILWSRLRNRGIRRCKFRRQYPIGNYFVDFVCLERKLIIELDGSQHKKERQREYDESRTMFLSNQGYRVVRFWDNEVNSNLNGVIMKIESVLDGFC